MDQRMDVTPHVHAADVYTLSPGVSFRADCWNNCLTTIDTTTEMGNITPSPTQNNSIDFIGTRLAQVELQLCFQLLDTTSRLRVSRTCRACLKASNSPFAWKYAPPIDFSVRMPSTPPGTDVPADEVRYNWMSWLQSRGSTHREKRPEVFSDARICRSLLRFCSLNLVWKDPEWHPPTRYFRDVPERNEIEFIRQFPNIFSLTIERRHIHVDQVETLLSENQHLHSLRALTLNRYTEGWIDFVNRGSMILNFNKLRHCELPLVKFTYDTYRAFMTQLPELTSVGFSEIVCWGEFTDEELKSMAEFEFTSKITHCNLGTLSTSVHHQRPSSSYALAHHLLSHAPMHLALDAYGQLFTDDLTAFLESSDALKNVTHLTVSRTCIDLLLKQLLRHSPDRMPSLSHLTLYHSLHGADPSVDEIRTILTERPHLQIQFVVDEYARTAWYHPFGSHFNLDQTVVIVQSSDRTTTDIHSSGIVLELRAVTRDWTGSP